MDNKQELETALGIVHHFSAGVYAKQALLPAGALITQHKHKYDHMSILASGRVLVGLVEYVAPACINVPAGLNHSVLALEDSVWFCVHATDETDVESIDEVLIQES